MVDKIFGVGLVCRRNLVRSRSYQASAVFLHYYFAEALVLENSCGDDLLPNQRLIAQLVVSIYNFVLLIVSCTNSLFRGCLIHYSTKN